LIYVVLFFVVYIAITLTIVSYRVLRLGLYNVSNHKLIMNLLIRIEKQLITHNADMEYRSVAHFKELKADILHNAAEFYRLREELKSRDVSAPEPLPPRSVKRGRLRLEPEVVPPEQVDP
jgi:hypothetical protein